MPSRANQNSTHWTKAAAEQQHQNAADQIYMSPFIMHQPPTAEHMPEREQENQHRPAKMQAEQATIQAILRTLII